MHDQRLFRVFSCLRLSATLVVCVVAASAAAQAIRFGPTPTAAVELAAPQAEVVPNTIANRLEQARTLAAHKEWGEVIEILTQLLGENTAGVVDLGDGRFVSLQTYCHFQLTQLPAEALALYRQHVDVQVEQSYREGVSTRNEDLLRDVVDEFFCSSWGDDALLVLGEFALERGDHAAARRWWEQISPLLRDPAGRPLWLALHGIDLDTHWREVAHRWNERPTPPAWLVYPDTSLDLDSVRARLVLASIRAGDLKRAAIELDAFRRFHPNSSGRLGGQEGPYVAGLERLLNGAADLPAESPDRNWSTFAGSPTRSPNTGRLGPIIGPTWEEPIALDSSRRWARVDLGNVQPFNRNLGIRIRTHATIETEKALDHFPAASDGVVYFGDGAQMRAASAATGKPAITADGVIHRSQPPRGRAVEFTSGIGFHTLTVAHGVVYGRFGHASANGLNEGDALAADQLIGVDVRREGVLAFRTRADDATWSFDGAPVSDGKRVFVAMRQGDVMPHAYVACFDAVTSQRLWRTPIGSADMPPTAGGSDVPQNLLTLAGDRIYFNTNLGLVAALDTHDGRISWIRQYERRTSEPYLHGQSEPLPFQRNPSPCLLHQGLVVVAPADTPSIFALDADTGQMIWSTDKLPDALHLLGVVRQNLMVGGHRLSAIDIRTGKIKFTWPESQTAGIRGMGRGLVAGDEIFWPTRNEIYVIHGVTGARSRTPIRLGAISDGGANLAAANGRLLVAGHDKIMVFGPALPVPPSRKPAKAQNRIATSP
jgi:outer membrane protein assembly factor BamB